ncbi:glycosyltransferase family 4 protein [Burkholderia cepacia]|uniref:glycosyltransferase family 4 protein n=1 Tax=Burkholderia cepacia TaxID=292 RepID=UPI00075949DB|nr:glycosyltransferase family 1 protein [Burkholderia cepacia]KWC77574.1 glycosyl transferase family 1 [Burkholderia cepacia]KWH54013.1 glycosyl transferase family 1 [Burkholderia cepacia]UIY57327.1 glycosyltransferase family 4 protein [Burkholderia cepacia]
MKDVSRIIALDGHNLALPKGTGVATYAKSLAEVIRGMGWNAWTLYGAPIPASQNAMMREIAFFDFLGGAKKKQGFLGKIGKELGELLGSPFGYTATEIEQSGVVETRRFDARLPNGARIFNVNDLFLVARKYFKLHGRFLNVKFESQPDIMHWTYPLPVRAVGIPNIYTIHDLVPLRLPYTTLDNKRYYHRLIKTCIDSGEHICTVSEKSKEDIKNLFSISDQKLTNTYQAVDMGPLANARAISEAEMEVEGIYGLRPYEYFLFFGAIEPKKNVGRLIEAYLSSKVNAKLVIVGSAAWKSREEMKLFHSLVKSDSEAARNIKMFDYAPRSFLTSLIRCSKAVVFPSLYEGFGLPVLEAMQLGVPTLTSSEGSLPEISGGASLTVDPYDISSIAKGLFRLDQDAAIRSELGSAGLIQAKTFSSEIYRTRLASMYASLI